MNRIDLFVGFEHTQRGTPGMMARRAHLAGETLQDGKEFLEDLGFRSFFLHPGTPYRTPVFFREDNCKISDFTRLTGGFVTLNDLRGGIAPSCPMEKNNERKRSLVFGVPRREVQGVDDLIPRHGALVSEILLILTMMNARLGLSLHGTKPQGGEDKKGFHY